MELTEAVENGTETHGCAEIGTVESKSKPSSNLAMVLLRLGRS